MDTGRELLLFAIMLTTVTPPACTSVSRVLVRAVVSRAARMASMESPISLSTATAASSL